MPKQYTKDEAEALRKRVLDAAREVHNPTPERLAEEDKLSARMAKVMKHYHRKVKKKEYRFKVITPADGDIRKWLFS